MANSLITTVGTAPVGDNTTRYIGLAGGCNIQSTESRCQVPIRDAGVFSKLYCYVQSNTIAANSDIFLRKSAANTAMTVQYTSTQTGLKEDTTNTATFAATDEANYSCVCANDAAGVRTITISVLGVMFTPDAAGDCLSVLAGISDGTITFSTDDTTVFLNPNSTISGSTDEAGEKFRIRGTFASQDLFANVAANTRTTDSSFGSRKNGADGGLIVTYTSGQTGQKEDTTSGDSLVAGDDYNYFIRNGSGGGTLTYVMCSSNLISTANQFVELASGSAAVTTGATRYVGAAGSTFDNTATEANTQIYPRVDFDFKELVAYVATNTTALDSTIVARDNGSDSALIVTIGTLATGLFSDTTHSFTATSGGDEINYRITAGTGGTLTVTWIGMLGETAAVAGGQPAARRFGQTQFNRPVEIGRRGVMVA